MPSKRKVETWSAVLTPLAAKLNFTSQLASVTLADVLSGETCRPIRYAIRSVWCPVVAHTTIYSLADFEGYLTFRVSVLECSLQRQNLNVPTGIQCRKLAIYRVVSSTSCLLIPNLVGSHVLS